MSDKDSRTMERSREGKDCLIGGRIFLTALKNCTTNGSSAHLLPVAAEMAATCTFKVLSPNPKSRLVWRKSRIWEEEGV